MTINPEQVFEVARPAMVDEIQNILDHLVPSAMTAGELVALLTVLRPPYERFTAQPAQPAPVLELVPSTRNRKR